MNPIKKTYPLFEANQVLTNDHLNQAIDYLAEQERLTRANLIGIGIVCGLEVTFDSATPSIHVSKGCGITSEGYVIVLPEQTFTGYREYQLPDELAYGQFQYLDNGKFKQYPLLELFPDGVLGNPTKLTTAGNFLADKVLLLFLELKKSGLRNCSPNNCDDKGADVTVTVKPLLIAKIDLDKIIAVADTEAQGQAPANAEATLAARLALPDLSLPRFDVSNTNPSTSLDILLAFQAVFRNAKLAAATGEALSKAYQVFKPLVQDVYASDPFADFTANFGFLDTAPTSTSQARFLQYYYDFFDDLLKAYDELRWQGLRLLCGCCPPEMLFRRHLMLGLLNKPANAADASVYRNDFLSSPAISDCDELSNEIVQLFRRLLEMIIQFSYEPSLPPVPEPSIRITPSRLGDVPLSDKAIPYYYQKTGSPPLYELWSYEKSQRHRSKQNLSYRSYEYAAPTSDFVRNPLAYDLEPYDFLRIEGHLGRNYKEVKTFLLEEQSKNRLPIDLLVLRTGKFDDSISLDPNLETNTFKDLEALYVVLREELLCTLTEGILFLYDIVMDNLKLIGGTPKISLLKTYSANYRFKENTVGAWYEKNLPRIQALSYLNINQNAVDRNEVFNKVIWRLIYTEIVEWNLYLPVFGAARNNALVMENEKATTSATNDYTVIDYYIPIILIYYFSKLAEVLPASLQNFNYLNFENRYQDLVALIRYFQSNQDAAANIRDVLKQDELIDQLNDVLYSCKLQPIKALYDNYLRRLRETKQKYFLSDFLKKHPGIQHKAGVPLGGTFVLVYHGNPKATDLVASYAIDKMIIETVRDFKEGDIIADFYLPYRLSNDSRPVPYEQPAPAIKFVTEECEFVWIDSIKHINYLCLRDYRFIGTEKSPAANEKERNRLKDSYVIRIFHYDIQGHSLLADGQIDISIPIATLLTKKLAAIAQALNKQFPSGLVFDCKQDSNQLLVRHVQGQDFRIELAGMQGNQLRYAYQNDGVFRWQRKRWEKLGCDKQPSNCCHILAAAYQAEAYQWLHENYPPSYPDPAPAPTLKEVIEWENLSLARARKFQSANELPIANLLFNVARAIRQIDSSARVILVGCWANGSWVSRNANENLLEGEEWLHFLDLRKKVTGKTGYSDIDLLIASENAICADMIKVSSAYAINIFSGREAAQRGLVIRVD